MKLKFGTHMRMLRGNPRARNRAQNLRIEAIELKSISITTISAVGVSRRILSLTSAALFTSLAGIISLNPLFANTLAVSAPIPDVAPAFNLRTN